MDPLEDLFNSAASYMQFQATSEQGKKLDQSQLLILYGLYKSATIGPCNEQKPGIFNPKGRSKWEAWKQASSLTKDEAQESYVKKVKEFFNLSSDWNTASDNDYDDKASHNSSASFRLGGNAVSTFATTPEDERNDTQENPVFGWAKDNDIEKITEWLDKGNDINLKDEDGLSILHWVVDRGHVEACKHLLGHGADPLAVDADGQTPLDYAITCEHEKIIRLLQTNVADQKTTNNISTTSNP